MLYYILPIAKLYLHIFINIKVALTCVSRV